MKTNLLRDTWIRRLFITLFKSMVMLLVVSLIPFRIHADSNITEESIFSGRENISLNKIFGETGKNSGGLTSYLPSFLFNYEITVRGIVSTGTGDPMPGVNVIQKGTTHGTTTDADGRYSLSVPDENAVLIFSFIGYTSQEVVVNGRSVIDITMAEDVQSLDEVVVIGYGTVKKENLTGSVSQIKSGAIEERAITTLGEAFVGQLAGVLAQQSSGGVPGAELTIKIRGIHSINASNDPLYVIDGIPSSNMQDINPNDVASIEVLKDASSAAIYGARGAGGVVLITTKHGKNEKPSFDFIMTYGLQKVDKLMDMMNSDEYIAWNIWGRNQEWLRAGGSLSDPMSIRSVKFPDKWLTPETLPDINWQNEILRIAPIKNYQLTTSGGGDMGTFFISGSYMKEDGIMKETDYERATFRINTTLNVGQHLKLGMNIAPSFSTSHNPDNTRGGAGVNLFAALMPSIVPLKSNTQEWGFEPGVSSSPNPLSVLKETHQESKNNKILTNVWGEWSLAKSLVFKSQYGYNLNEAHSSYFKPSNVNTNGAASFGNAGSSSLHSWSLQNTMTYTPKITSLFDINLLLGQSTEESKYFILSASKNGYPNDLVYTMNVASTPTLASSSESENSLSSFYGRLNFNAKDRYLLTANLRRDGSSKFGSDTKWGWFPSASIGWKINREEFMKNSTGWIDLLKLRLSFGKAGNNSIGDYESIPLLGISNYNLNGAIVNGLAPTSFGNPELGWETMVSKGIGLDLIIFKNKIEANIDYYVGDTKDMLLNAPLPFISGYSSVRQNLGEVRNKGWEFELTSHNLEGRFNWITSFNISRNINEVKKLGSDDSPIITYCGGSGTNITKVGEAIGSYYMYKTDGLLLDDDFDATGKAIVPIAAGQEKGNVKAIDINGDGQITAADQTIVGSNQPDFIWGLTNRISYNNFDITIFLQGSQGGEIFFSGARHLDLGQTVNGFNQLKRWLRSWKQEYPPGENPYPQNTGSDLSWDGKTPNRFGNNLIHNDTWVYDASYIRIKSITVGYNLPKDLFKRVGVGQARIYLMADNFFTWTKYPGNTPESNTFGNETTQIGSDYGTYPLSRTYSLSINLKF